MAACRITDDADFKTVVKSESEGRLTKACTGAARVSFTSMASIVRRPGDARR